jgi:hypothetical protein
MIVRITARNGSRSVVLKHSATLALAGSVDATLNDSTKSVTLIYDTDGARWEEWCRNF